MKSAFAILLVLSFATIATASTQKMYEFNQGWDATSKKFIYNVNEGSQLMPLNWFLALEKADSNKLLVKNIGAYGLINIKDSKENLPMGFGVDENPDTEPVSLGEKKWVGINCVACHTGVLTIGSKNILIQGGASQYDHQRFHDDILKSFDQLLADPSKFARFQKAQANKQDLQVRVQKFRDAYKAYIDRSNHYIHEGKEFRLSAGQVDGIGQPANETLCSSSELGDLELKSKLTNPDACRTLHAPSTFPMLWGITKMEWTQLAGFVHAGPLRNYGQASGTFARNWYEKGSNGQIIFRTSARLNNIIERSRMCMTV